MSCFSLACLQLVAYPVGVDSLPEIAQAQGIMGKLSILFPTAQQYNRKKKPSKYGYKRKLFRLDLKKLA